MALVRLAVNPERKVNSALASSSAPVGPIRPLAVSPVGSANGVPSTIPAIKRAKETGIAADVEDAAAAERQVEQPMFGHPGHAKPEISAHVTDRSDRAVLQQRQELPAAADGSDT